MECLKEDIPPRYHKYIPRSYFGRSSQDSDCRSNISTIHLPMPTASHTSGANRFDPNQQLESTSAAEPPSYRSRSNVQVTLMLPNSYSMSRNTFDGRNTIRFETLDFIECLPIIYQLIKILF